MGVTTGREKYEITSSCIQVIESVLKKNNRKLFFIR